MTLILLLLLPLFGLAFSGPVVHMDFPECNGDSPTEIEPFVRSQIKSHDDFLTEPTPRNRRCNWNFKVKFVKL